MTGRGRAVDSEKARPAGERKAAPVEEEAADGNSTLSLPVAVYCPALVLLRPPC